MLEAAALESKPCRVSMSDYYIPEGGGGEEEEVVGGMGGVGGEQDQPATCPYQSDIDPERRIASRSGMNTRHEIFNFVVNIFIFYFERERFSLMDCKFISMEAAYQEGGLISLYWLIHWLLLPMYRRKLFLPKYPHRRN